MNKKELAEQIAEAEKLFDKHWDIVFLEDTDSNPYYSRPKSLIGYQAHKAAIAAIIEAMGEKPESMDRWICINDMVARIPDGYCLTEPFTVEFGGDYQLQISPIDGKYRVTNGVNGYGNNCKEEFRDADVKILCESVEAMGVQPGMSEENKQIEVIEVRPDSIGFGLSDKNTPVAWFVYESHATKYATEKWGEFFKSSKVKIMLNNEQEVKVSGTTDDTQRYVADNQEAIEPKGE